MNRIDLQRLADERIADAQALLEVGRWAAAYYLIGYAVECALKACIARQFRAEDVPEKSLVNQFYSHNLSELLKLAGLGLAHDVRVGTDRTYQDYWNTVRDWRESSRYDNRITEQKARDLFAAVTDPTSGVLPWLKTLW